MPPLGFGAWKACLGFVSFLLLGHLRPGHWRFLAVQDSSMSDIVCLSVPWSEPTNNQSLGSIKE